MSDNIKLLLKFYNQCNNADLFTKINYFKESITVNEFKEDLEEILVNESVQFKINRIKFIDKEFQEEVDLPKSNFIFEHLQVFKIFCDVRIFYQLIDYLISFKFFLKEIQMTNDNTMYAVACASINSLNLEESKPSIESELQSLFDKKKSFDTIPDGSNLGELTSFRKKVVRLLCAHMMSKQYSF